MIKRFGLIAGCGCAAGAGGRFATILMAVDPTQAAVGLDAVSGVLDQVLVHRAAITELKKREDDFDATLAWTSHELRGPVQATKLVLGHVIEGGNLDADLLDLLRRSERALSRLSEDVGRILSWAVSAGTGSLNLERIDFGELVKVAVDSILSLEEQGRVVLDLRPGLGVQADETHLRGAVANVVRNALDYSPPNSEVRVSLDRKGSEAVLAVSNPGSLPDSERTAVFDRFARGGAGAKQPNGSGLGLFVADRVARGHGGRIFAESSGTEITFFLHLPASIT